MTVPDNISADYTLPPSKLASVLALLVEARQPAVVWGPPGAAKSQIAQQVAAATNRRYVDVRALLLDPVDLRGIPWRDADDRTRWAPPAFLPPSDDPGRWLINLEELPSAVPMVQAALYQLVLDRKVGEYELPEGASLIACGNRETDRGVVHRMPTPLASRFVHVEIRVDAEDWLEWGAANGIVPEVLFFVTYEPDLLHRFDPQSTEKAFPCPRTWEFVSNIVKHRNGLDPATERALFRGTVGEAAAVEFSAFLNVWRELPHPRAVLNDPGNAAIPENASALMALCGSLYRLATDVTIDAIVTFAQRLRREVGESLVGACVRRDPALQRSPAFIRWAAAKTQ
ncbi:MAG: MoxR family ATPase [Deltaproteobacteria bacterium]|nr:MoxR family ATPase [Deltaproteobacteria bacterium]